MATKLYKAEVTSVYYFLAEEGTEERVARKAMKEALDNDNEKAPEVSEVNRFEHTMDWDDEDLLVYGTNRDTTLAEAYEIGVGETYEEGREDFHKRFSRLAKE